MVDLPYDRRTPYEKRLFDLCRRVYELTNWGRMNVGGPTDEYFVASVVQNFLDKPDVIKGWRVARWEDFPDSGRLHYNLGKEQAYPKYTSDYIMEKWPLRTDSILDTAMLGRGTDNRGWSIVYQDIVCLAPTPLEAQLKLIIKLAERGDNL